MFLILRRALCFGIISHITKREKKEPRSGSVLFSEFVNRYFFREFRLHKSFEVKVSLMEKPGL